MSKEEMGKVIELKNIVKEYIMGDVSVKALNGVDIDINRGEFVAIMGASGSGKSTLMNILGCLDVLTSGDYLFEGQNINSLKRDEYAKLRNQKIGFVFQGFNLLSRTTAIENVELPLLYNAEVQQKEIKNRAINALTRVGLKERLYHEPNKMSGGQQQRVAIARALINNPSIVLADEPTGNLDTYTSLDIMSIFQELNDQGITIVLVTHENDIATYAKRVITMRDGLVISDRSVDDRHDAKIDKEKWLARKENQHLEKTKV
jgi:putative ABC transport system ATP-binding protein